MQKSKPILIGGITLSVGLWALNNLHFFSFPLEDLSILSTIALGGGLWLLRKKAKITTNDLPIKSLTQADLNQIIKETKTAFQILEKEAENNLLIDFKSQFNQLDNLMKQEALNITIIGVKYTGKTSLKALLKNHLKSQHNIIFTENLEDNFRDNNQENIDLILYIINGDLTDSQWQLIQQLKGINYRVILILNKVDRYLAEEKFLILQQIKQRVKNLIAETDILEIACQPLPIKVKQYQKDGQINEYLEEQTPQIDNLLNHLQSILTQETEQLNLEKSWRNAFFFKQKIKEKLNQIRKEISLPLIEKYQFIAAGTTFANPISSLDLLATAAINGQLLIDLSEIYQQKFTLEQGQNLGSIMGKLMVQLGLVEISTQTISNLLKTNAITYVAGGTIQAISAAYLTRLAGLSLIEYYQEQDCFNPQETNLNLEQLGEKIKQVFQQNQRSDFLLNFVKQTLKFKSV